MSDNWKIRDLEYWYVNFPKQVGAYVRDDLTKNIEFIKEIVVDENGHVAYVLSGSWLDGLRLPWEISRARDVDHLIPSNIVLSDS
jgi:hypothetical protein